jgi:two-component system phosphate regulon response regulator PhoB
MRRARPALSEERLTYSDIEMNLTEHKVARNNRPVVLGPTEFRLLRHFMEHPGRVFSRDQLIDSVWGHGIFIDSRTVDVHIRRLRKALNGKDEQDVIRTVRSAGYALDAEAAIA